MLNLVEPAINNCIHQLKTAYHQTYGSLNPDYPEILAWATGMALEQISHTDAAYHNVEHTILVTLTGQEILRGKHIREGGVSPEDWLHCVLSLLCHDIGYIKGICRRDRPEYRLYATGVGTKVVVLAPGTTDASLTPYHVDRGKQFIDERFEQHKLLDIERIKHNIELTRFPIPNTAEHQQTDTYPGLIRAADLIGQLADPRYLQKLPALYQEFEENGTNKQLGHNNPGELRAAFPSFFWNVVYPYVKDGSKYLEVTQNGQQILSNLYANVFIVEHENQNPDLFSPKPLQVIEGGDAQIIELEELTINP